MFNPYYYRNENREEDEEKAERKARHHKFKSEDMAAKSRMRMAASTGDMNPNIVEYEPTYLSRGFHESRLEDNPRRWQPNPASNPAYSFRNWYVCLPSLSRSLYSRLVVGLWGYGVRSRSDAWSSQKLRGDFLEPTIGPLYNVLIVVP